MYSKFRLTSGASSTSPPENGNKNKATTTLAEKIEDPFTLGSLYTAANTNCVGKWQHLLNTAVLGPKEIRLVYFFAIQSGNLQMLQIALRHQKDINLQDSNGNTGISLATRAGHVDILNYLIEAGGNIKTPNAIGQCPIHIAAYIGADVRCLECLLTSGVDINVLDKDGNTPLLLATRKGNFKEVSALIKNADPSIVFACDGLERNALHIATAHGYGNVSRALFEKIIDVDAKDAHGMTALHLAARSDLLAIVTSLIDRGATIDLKDKQGLTALGYAVTKGNANVVHVLLQNGSDPNVTYTDGQSLLVFALSIEEKRIAKLLITFKCDVHKTISNRTPLAWACIHSYDDVVELLIKNGANPDHGKEPPLKFAAMYGHTLIAQQLINHGAKIDIKAITQDATPLMYAVDENQIATAKVLLKNGADVNAKTVELYSTILVPISRAQYDMFDLLLTFKPKLNVRCVLGQTPLHVACESSNLSIVKKLLKAGADPDATDNVGYTPIFSALKSEKFDILAELIRWDCDINLKGKFYTLCQQALIYGFVDIAKLLVDIGCSLNFMHEWMHTSYPSCLADETKIWFEERAKKPHSLKVLTRHSISNVLRKCQKSKFVADRKSKLPLPQELIEYLYYSDA